MQGENNLLPGFDATGQGRNGAPSGDDAHGTATAGCIIAQANNNDGVAGIAHNARVMPVRVIFGDVSTDTWLADAINAVFGNIISQTDATGLLTTMEYDAFGRLKKTITPEGNAITATRDWAGGSPANAVFFTETQAPGAPDVKVFYDLLGRELRSERDGFTQKIFVDRSYNAKGQLSSATHPRYASDPVKTIAYGYNNDFGFLETENNNGLTTTYSISGNTTTITNPAGQTFTNTTDAAGALVSASDAGGTVSYTYFSHGGAKDITAAGTQTLMEYDEYGRQTKLTDPNAGVTQYEYNAFGELTFQEDANGNIYNNFQYDLLGRIVSKTGPEGTYTYSYVTTGNGLENIKKIIAPNGSTAEYEYDKFSRLIKITENIQGNIFITHYEYDNFGNITRIIYPFGYFVENVYDANGYLAEVNSPQGTIYTTDEMNALNQHTEYTLGNGIQTQRTFHPFGLPESIIAGSVQNYLPGWDISTGTLNFRSDQLKGLVETFTPYDNLNRLTNHQATGQPPMTVSYSPNGNITSKTDAGIYTYDPSKPHAVQSVTDPDGLMPLTQNITYTPFKRPETITEGDYELEFTYGPDNQRKKSILTNLSTGVVEKTITYAGSYEKIETPADVYEVHYIVSGAGLVAINVRQNGGADQLFYVYTDHLGSILKLTDATGTVIYEQNFDPWGRDRNPDTWDYTANPNTKPPWLIRGFTGHEHHDEVALINMNARLYDPIVARVLSPDNIVEDATRTQGYNRYSYALNNPLVYTDPDGDFVLLLALGIFVVGNVSDHLLNYNNYGHQSVGEAIKVGASEAVNAYNQITSLTQIPVYSRNGVTITVGPSLTGLGITGGVSYTTEEWTFGVSAGAGYNSNPFAKGWEPRIGGGVSYYDDINNLGFSAGITRFGGAHAQYNWIAGFRSGDFSIKMVNDAFLGSDDYRTAALELQYKEITAGFSIYTTGVKGSLTDAEDEQQWSSKKWGAHIGEKGSYLNGQRLQSSVYVGYNNGFTVSRIGIDNPNIQDYIQNGWHQSWVFRQMVPRGSPYIRTDYGTPSRVYGFDSPYYPYSLY